MKRGLRAAMALCLMVFGATSVNARTYTQVLNGQDVYSGQTTTSSVTNLASTNYDSVRGDRTYFYVVSAGWLEADICVADNSRTATVVMYEDDVYPNEDDKIKTYVFKFSGRTLSDVKSITTNQATNIDSSGDNSVELYQTTYVKPITGDRSGNNGALFTYQFAVD